MLSTISQVVVLAPGIRRDLVCTFQTTLNAFEMFLCVEVQQRAATMRIVFAYVLRVLLMDHCTRDA